MSVAGAIADAVAAAVTALNWGAPVTRRKTPSVPAGTTLPQVVVTVGEEGPVEPLTARSQLVRYPVSVVYATTGGRALADDAQLRDRREALRNLLFTASTYAAVTQFNSAEPVGKTPFDPSALALGVVYTEVVVTVETIEART